MFDSLFFTIMWLNIDRFRYIFYFLDIDKGGTKFFFELRYSGPVKKLQNGLDKKILKNKFEIFLA